MIWGLITRSNKNSVKEFIRKLNITLNTERAFNSWSKSYIQRFGTETIVKI